MVPARRHFPKSEGSAGRLSEARLEGLPWCLRPKPNLGHKPGPNRSPDPNPTPTGVYDERCDGSQPYLCKGSPFSTGFGGSCLHKPTTPLYRVFKPTTNMELKRAIQTCSRSSGGLVESAGDTVGGAGCTLNPVKGKATHAVIWLHGMGDTCEAWSDAMKGLGISFSR